MVGLGPGEAHRGVGSSQTLGLATRTEHEGMRMSGVGVLQLLGRGIDDHITEAEEHLRGLELVAESVVDLSENHGRIARLEGVDTRRAHGQCHDQSRRESVSRDIADHYPDFVVGKLEDMEEVPADLLGGCHPGGHVGLVERLRRLQELHLKMMGQLHLVAHPLLGHALLDQSIVLEGRTDLASYGGQEPLVTNREGIPHTAEEVDDADRAHLSGWWAVADGDGDVGRGPPVPPVVGISAATDARPAFLEYQRGDGIRMVVA